MDELEQLKRDNEVLYRDNVTLSETADRLREALDEIADGPWGEAQHRNIAREALEVGK